MTTKHKAGESPARRRFRRIVEQNKKVITKHFRLDYEKHVQQHIKELGEYYRSITTGFSDKEMEEAMKIGLLTKDKGKPEDGVSYEELAAVLWGVGDDYKVAHAPFEEVLPAEYIKDDAYVSKIDRLLYVLENIVCEFVFNTTLEPEENGRRVIPLVPCVVATKTIKDYDEQSKKEVLRKLDKPVETIFNGAGTDYAFEHWEKNGQVQKLKKSDAHYYVLPKHLQPTLTRVEKEAEMILNNLKGRGEGQPIDEYMDGLTSLVRKISDTFLTLGKERDMLEEEMIYHVIPEASGKTGEELELHKARFFDAMYVFFVTTEHGKNKKWAQELHREWKRDHGYLGES